MPSNDELQLPTIQPTRRWTVAKWVTLGAFVLTIAALFTAPERSLRVVWFLLVPVLPAVFLVNAELWRNVCPLATLNTLMSDDEGGLPLGPGAARIAAVVGVVLLLLAIFGRVLLFNDSGQATGTLFAGAGVLALVSGIPFQRKAGFCNSICPVLAVERLYGQSPLIEIRNARCTPCLVCTRAACYDLNPSRSALQIIGAAAGRLPWVLLPFGVFALAFPGVIGGYAWASMADGPVAAIVLGGAASWVVLAGTFALIGTRPAVGLLLAASLSAGLFYWFTPPTVAVAFGLPDGVATLLRVAGLGLVAWWTVRAAGRRRARRLGREASRS